MTTTFTANTGEVFTENIGTPNEQYESLMRQINVATVQEANLKGNFSTYIPAVEIKMLGKEIPYLDTRYIQP